MFSLSLSLSVSRLFVSWQNTIRKSCHKNNVSNKIRTHAFQQKRKIQKLYHRFILWRKRHKIFSFSHMFASKKKKQKISLVLNKTILLNRKMWTVFAFLLKNVEHSSDFGVNKCGSVVMKVLNVSLQIRYSIPLYFTIKQQEWWSFDNLMYALMWLRMWKSLIYNKIFARYNHATDDGTNFFLLCILIHDALN